MSDPMMISEIDGNVELLPARTVLSLYGSGFFFPDFDDANINVNTNENTATADASSSILGSDDDGAGPGPTP